MKSKLKFLILCVACLFGTTPLTAQSNSSYSDFIVVDSANKMISSYLNSIHYSTNDTDLFSVIVDAAKLKDYIDEASNTITHFKLILAHKLAYINSGRGNQPAGYLRNALTLIIAAYDNNGDPVYFDGTKVLDYSSPCPPDCPPGEIASPVLPE